MDVRDAALATVMDYPGGAAVVAIRMGLSTDELRGKINPKGKAHPLTLHESVSLQAVTGDYRILYAMAEELGFSVAPADNDVTA